MWIERLVRSVLGLAPAGFRERFGDEYLATVRERLRAHRGGAPARVVLGVREVAGAVRTVIRLRTGLERTPSERTYTERGGESTMMTYVWDLGRAARTLRRNPAFVAAAVAVLALGIGANTAIFSAVNAYFFRPLPFEEADRLVLLFETNPEFGWTDVSSAPANALDWRDQVEAFEDLASYDDYGANDVTLQLDGEPVLVSGATVTGNFFSVLGVEALHGRTLEYAETWDGADDVVVVSHRFWTERLGADPNAVGGTLRIGGSAREVRVVGVMPAGFAFPYDRTDLWLSYGWDLAAREQVWFRRAHFTRAVARLADGYTLAEADAQLQTVVGRLQNEYPETNAVMGAGMTPMRDFLIRDVRGPLMVLLGAVAVLLLLACANVANLMLVRANDRGREVALRHALGAGRGRIVRELLIESLLLAFVGGAAGLALGWVGVQAMGRMTQLGIDGATGIALDGRVVGFTLVVVIASGALFGLVPAFNVGRRGIHTALREGGRGGTAGRNRVGASRLLVATEVALALLLVVGAGLMIRSSLLLQQVDPGFAVDGSLAVRLSVPSARYPDRDQVVAFWDRLSTMVEGRAGIERAGTVSLLPLRGTSWSSQFQAEGWPPERVGFEILHRRVDRGYFDALDIPLVRGRHFTTADGPNSQPVIVVNEAFVEEHFPNEDPIGQRIAYTRAATPESTWYEIVGIVGDQHQAGLGQPARAEVFEHRRQDWGRDGWMVMRTSVDPLSVVPAVRSALAEIDPQVPLAEVEPLRDVWRGSMSRERFLLTLLGAFGLTALLLATVGVYGVTAQAARRRTQEIGIRMALGASGQSVVGMMLRQGLVVIGAGLLVGLVTSLAASRVMSGLLFGVEPTDPLTLAAVVGLLGTVGLTACYVPARRATAVDPVSSLRAE